MDKIEVKNLIIDLVFDKWCEVKEVAYHENKLVCRDLVKMKEDLKEKLNVMFKEENIVSQTTKTNLPEVGVKYLKTTQTSAPSCCGPQCNYCSSSTCPYKITLGPTITCSNEHTLYGDKDKNDN